MICGIDPGLSGALFFLYPDGSGKAFDMPTLLAGRAANSKRRDLDMHALFRLLKSHQQFDHVFIEQAQAMPKQSAYATGVFFQNYGQILGLLVGASLPYSVVHPQTWKRAFNLRRAKDAARARASELMPLAADQWPLKKQDGRAEAALIALWGMRVFAGLFERAGDTANLPKVRAGRRKQAADGAGS